MQTSRWMMIGVVLALQIVVGGLSSAMAGPATDSLRAPSTRCSGS
jgi:phospholipid transport system substrate-binding protein